MAGLLIAAPDVYTLILRLMIKLPAVRPFTDWEWIPASVRCWSEGVDVYVNNTCYKSGDNLGFNYSPVWLRLGFLKYADQAVPETAIAGILLFFVSFAALPPAPDRRALYVLLFAVVSSGTMLAVERTNVDIFIYLLVFAAIQLSRFTVVARLFGYGLIMFAGLLKFYPFVALVLAARERLAVVLALAAVSAGLIAWVVLAFPAEIASMVKQLPAPSIFSLQFGAADLPTGLGLTLAKLLYGPGPLGAAAGAVATLTRQILTALLVAAALLGALLLGRRMWSDDAAGALGQSRASFLLVGGAIICGCFFAGQSVIYRGLFLFLTLPALATFRITGGPTGRLATVAEWGIVLVMWMPFCEIVFYALKLTPLLRYQGDPVQSFPDKWPGYLLWLGGELVWWGLITLFIATTAVIVLRGDAVRSLLRLLRPGRTV